MIPQLSFYKYTPIYQGSTLQESVQALDRAGKTFDANLDENNKVQTFFSSIKALPGDRDYLNQKGAEMANIIKGISDKHGVERWDLAGSKVQQLRAAVTQDPKLNAIRESYLNYQKEEETKQAMRNKGEVPFVNSDFASHRSFDDQGNINIYQPNVELKADYVKTADDIIKNIAPDIVEAQLMPSEVEGILQGKTIRGISKEKLLSKLNAVKSAYDQTSEGQQHYRFLQKNDPEINGDQFVKDFLFNIGTIRTFNEERSNRMVDPSYEWAQKGLLEQQKIQGRLDIKRATGRGNYDPRHDGLFRIETLKGKGEVGKERKVGSGLMFSNKNIIEGLGAATWLGDGSGVKQISSKDGKKFDWQHHSIIDFKPKGYAMDEYEGEGTLGGMIGDIKYMDTDGKEHWIQGVVKNSDPEIVNAFDTYKSLSNVLATQQKGDLESYKNKSVVDTSGLFNFTGRKVHLKVFPNNTISPVLETQDGKFEVPPDSVLKDLMLKRYYKMSDIQNLIIDKIAPKVLPYTETPAQINK
jgi:hypothetical protein